MRSKASAVACLALVALTAVTLQGCGGGATTTAAPAKPTTTLAPTTLAPTQVPTTTTLAPIPTTTTTTTTFSDACLCLFDVDRTITSKQDAGGDGGGECPNSKMQKTSNGAPIHDNGYSGGNLHFSEGAVNLAKTPCAKCHMGIITRGNANGNDSDERKHITALLKASGTLDGEVWTDPYQDNTPVSGPLVANCLDKHKQVCAAHILTWFEKNKNIKFNPQNVTHFDDRHDNVAAFEGSGFNAIQVACDTKTRPVPQRGDGGIGTCGMTSEEVVLKLGIHPCVYASNPITEVV